VLAPEHGELEANVANVVIDRCSWSMYDVAASSAAGNKFVHGVRNRAS
jgi:hypothetical protein